MVESPREIRRWEMFKDVHLFNEKEYTTRRDKKTTKNQGGDEWRRRALKYGIPEWLKIPPLQV
ncbi:MAG: hypothetical protein E3K40_00225 [Candidatus Brocadia sp.]|nr:hypothetical protein [Candidatus Brocadia sp.]MDG6025143.1 hypothetical protein [Candidatus Brocadia sp.]